MDNFSIKYYYLRTCLILKDYLYLLLIFYWDNKSNKLGARTLGARSRGSKNVTYRKQTTDKKVNTEPL